jgi:branched-chain amino acid transport system permease protein
MIYRIINSPFGEVLKAIRENEARAISLGYRTERYKLMAFVLSATFAGVAGTTSRSCSSLLADRRRLADVGRVILMTGGGLAPCSGRLSAPSS